MKKVIRKLSLGASLALGLALLPVGAASALTSQSAGGGLWQWGVQGGQVISNYHHASRYHTATACDGSLFQTCVQKAAAANAWANATVRANSAFGLVNKAYWNVL